MRESTILKEMLGKNVLDITHSLNFTCFVIGDKYEIRMDCPWVLVDKNEKPLVASGDLFVNPEDFGKMEGDIAEWKMKYTLLDEKLNNLQKEKLIIEKISVLEFGDLEIIFSNEMKLKTFSDFSDRRYGWWVFETGKKSHEYFFEKIQKQKKEKFIDCSYWADLVGGKLIEIGRKKEARLKNAPISWLKICVPNESGGEKQAVVYFYCPWRICYLKKGEVVVGTSDLRPILCWENKQSPVLRENDYYTEKKCFPETVNLKITGVRLSIFGDVEIKFGEDFIFQSFVGSSGDGVDWRGYSLGEKEYFEGGAGFVEYHQGGYLKNVETKNENVDKYLKIFIGKTLKSISRKGTFYSFNFIENEQQNLELVCADQWRIKDTETNTIIVGGGDCRFPSTKYENMESIDWKTTINTKFEENYSRLSESRMVVTDIKANKHGDLQIFFSDYKLFEYVANASFSSEEWQIREYENVRLRAFANDLRVVDTMDTTENNWLDNVKFPENDVVVETYQKHQKGVPVVRSFRKIFDLVGEIWSLDLFNELSLPWRLYDFAAEKIVLGTEDFCFPDDETEWFDFFEKDEGTSLLERKAEDRNLRGLYIQSVETMAEGDCVICLSNSMQCCIFNNLGN